MLCSIFQLRYRRTIATTAKLQLFRQSLNQAEMHPSRPKAITENLTSTRSRSTYWCGTGTSTGSYCCDGWTTCIRCQLRSCCGWNVSSWKIDKSV